MSAIGGHQSHCADTVDWLTPPDLLEQLGEFDLDPCCPEVMPWPTAGRMMTQVEDGLSKPWFGRVWLNPPYGRYTEQWMEKLARHGNGIALIFARTETKIFFPWVWNHAGALLFLKGRVHFHHLDGTRAAMNSGAPSVLIAYGSDNVDALYQLPTEMGRFVWLPDNEGERA